MKRDIQLLTVPTLNFLYVHSTWIGYGRYGLKLAQALQKKGVRLHDSMGERHTGQDEFGNDLIGGDVCNVMALVSTPSHLEGWFQGQYKVLSTMFEATVLPESFRESLHEFELIIVPSEQNRELFSRFHPNVKKVPLGVDTSEWIPTPRPIPQDRFNFLIGGSGNRKGTDLAYKAFRRVFKTWPKGYPTPYLIFKSPKSEDYYGDRIERIGGRIKDRAERDLYTMAHCYLQPSRGEGWGLQPLQAMASGMPTILTNAHGHAEFAELGIPLSSTLKKADYFMAGDAGEWWEPNFDELCDRMWDVYDNYPDHYERAQVNAKLVCDKFSWARTADHFIDAVGLDRLLTPYTGSGEWKTASPRRYHVRVNKPWAANSAGTYYQFTPGKDYFETADLKRILYEAEVLDPSCIYMDPNGETPEWDNGLSLDQLKSFGDYSASMSYCHHCGQKLNTGELYEPPPFKEPVIDDTQ